MYLQMLPDKDHTIPIGMVTPLGAKLRVTKIIQCEKLPGWSAHGPNIIEMRTFPDHPHDPLAPPWIVGLFPYKYYLMKLNKMIKSFIPICRLNICSHLLLPTTMNCGSLKENTFCFSLSISLPRLRASSM